jgi:hypothetical protein
MKYDYCEPLAKELLFGQKTTNSAQFDEMIKRHGLQFRKNKTFKDAGEALRKGVKTGRGFVQFELEWVELYMRLDVLKKLPKGKQ